MMDKDPLRVRSLVASVTTALSTLVALLTLEVEEVVGPAPPADTGADPESSVVSVELFFF
jgi:hypothetical protein